MTEVKQRFDRAANTYDAISKGRFYSGCLRLFIKPLHVSEGEVGLDTGCGTGAATRFLAQMVGEHGRIYAIDISERMLEIAKRNLSSFGNLSFEVGDVRCLKFGDKIFDFVVASGLIYWMNDPEAGMREMFRVLKRGGRIAVSSPTPRLSSEGVHALVDHLRANWNAPEQLLTHLCPDLGDKDCVYSKADVLELVGRIGPHVPEVDFGHLLKWPEDVAGQIPILFTKDTLSRLMHSVGFVDVRVCETLDGILLGAYGVRGDNID